MIFVPTASDPAAAATLESDDEDELGASIYNASITAKLIRASQEMELSLPSTETATTPSSESKAKLVHGTPLQSRRETNLRAITETAVAPCTDPKLVDGTLSHGASVVDGTPSPEGRFDSTRASRPSPDASCSSRSLSRAIDRTATKNETPGKPRRRRATCTSSLPPSALNATVPRRRGAPDALSAPINETRRASQEKLALAPVGRPSPDASSLPRSLPRAINRTGGAAAENARTRTAGKPRRRRAACTSSLPPSALDATVPGRRGAPLCRKRVHDASLSSPPPRAPEVIASARGEAPHPPPPFEAMSASPALHEATGACPALREATVANGTPHEVMTGVNQKRGKVNANNAGHSARCEIAEHSDSTINGGSTNGTRTNSPRQQARTSSRPPSALDATVSSCGKASRPPALHGTIPRNIKPKFKGGQRVYAAWWGDEHRVATPTWYPGVIRARRERKERHGLTYETYGPLRLYDITFDDGDELKGVEDEFVFSEEDYLLQLKKEVHEWFGVRNVVDKESNDEWANTVGWYNVALADGVVRSFSFLAGVSAQVDCYGFALGLQHCLKMAPRLCILCLLHCLEVLVAGASDKESHWLIRALCLHCCLKMSLSPVDL